MRDSQVELVENIRHYKGRVDAMTMCSNVAEVTPIDSKLDEVLGALQDEVCASVESDIRKEGLIAGFTFARTVLKRDAS